MSEQDDIQPQEDNSDPRSTTSSLSYAAHYQLPDLNALSSTLSYPTYSYFLQLDQSPVLETWGQPEDIAEYTEGSGYPQFSQAAEVNSIYADVSNTRPQGGEPGNVYENNCSPLFMIPGAAENPLAQATIGEMTWRVESADYVVNQDLTEDGQADAGSGSEEKEEKEELIDEATEEKQWFCDQCNQSFSREQGL